MNVPCEVLLVLHCRYWDGHTEGEVLDGPCLDWKVLWMGDPVLGVQISRLVGSGLDGDYCSPIMTSLASGVDAAKRKPDVLWRFWKWDNCVLVLIVRTAA